jgi:UDP-N-acetylglucosamine transferase subunit ALG13
MPRLRAHGEHVDDHQAQIARKLAETGLAVVVEDDISPADVAAGTRPALARTPDAPSVADAVHTAIRELTPA